MTGFGAGKASDGQGTVGVQIAVVNHRHCQVNVRCEPRDAALENHLRNRVRDRVERGSVTVQMGFESGSALGLDGQALAAAWRELAALAKELGAPVPALEQVARLQQHGPTVDIDEILPLVDQALDQALADLDAMRAREGEALAAECRRGLAALEQLQATMTTQAAERLPAYRELLQARIEEALAGRVELAPADLLREVALHADRVDVREELVRLRSHLDQLRALIEVDESVGKKVEFLLQEVGREINTCGSKANDAGLTALVCEAKHVAEQLREQIANVL
jgi:uncharacterized protein (TIGR00255 family)